MMFKMNMFLPPPPPPPRSIKYEKLFFYLCVSWIDLESIVSFTMELQLPKMCDSDNQCRTKIASCFIIIYYCICTIKYNKN